MNVVATVQREYDSFFPSTAMINSVLHTFIHQEFVMKWRWTSLCCKMYLSELEPLVDCFTYVFRCEAHIHTMTKQLFLLIVCCSIFQEIDSFLLTGQAQHSCQSSIFDFPKTLLFLCSTLITVNKLYLNVCLCLSEQLWMCVSSHSHEAFLWKRAHWWWRVYWLVGKAPSISTRLKGDSSRPSYWHAELICSFWSITANWNSLPGIPCQRDVCLAYIGFISACVFVEEERMIYICVTGKWNLSAFLWPEMEVLLCGNVLTLFNKSHFYNSRCCDKVIQIMTEWQYKSTVEFQWDICNVFTNDMSCGRLWQHWISAPVAVSLKLQYLF